MLKGLLVFLGMLGASVMLGHAKARYDIDHCMGMADTPKCHSDLAKRQRSDGH